MIPEFSVDETIKQLNYYDVINWNLRLNRFLVEIRDVIFLAIPSVQSRLSQNGHTKAILAVQPCLQSQSQAAVEHLRLSSESARVRFLDSDSYYWLQAAPMPTGSPLKF